MIENIEQARKELEEVLGFAKPSKRRMRDYIASNKELLVLFTAKRHLPDLARHVSLRIQAAEEYLAATRRK